MAAGDPTISTSRKGEEEEQGVCPTAGHSLKAAHNSHLGCLGQNRVTYPAARKAGKEKLHLGWPHVQLQTRDSEEAEEDRQAWDGEDLLCPEPGCLEMGWGLQGPWCHIGPLPGPSVFPA